MTDILARHRIESSRRELIDELTVQSKKADYASVAVRQMKNKIALLRIELKDALMMAYGAECNWPETAKTALGDTDGT